MMRSKMASVPMMTVGTNIAEFLLPLATILLQDSVTLVAKKSASQGKSQGHVIVKHNLLIPKPIACPVE